MNIVVYSNILACYKMGAQILGARSPWELNFVVATNIFGSLLWNVLHISLLAPRILR